MSWLAGWTYRKKITITGESGAGTNYQVKLLIGESSGASGYDFHLENNSAIFPSDKNEGGDLRFTTSDEETLLDFWVESISGTTPNRTATIWVEVSADLGTNKDIYIYYDNSGASNLSNGNNTFLLFDDFDSTLDTDKWQIYTGNAITETGDLKVGGSSDNRVFTKTFSTEDCRVRAKRKLSAQKRSRIIHSHDNITTNAGLSYGVDAQRWTIFDATGTTDYISAPLLDTDYHNWEYTVFNDEVKGYVDGTYIGNRSGTTNADNIQIRAWDSGNYTYTDWIFVSKFVSVEPSFLSAEAEDIYGVSLEDTITLSDVGVIDYEALDLADTITLSDAVKISPESISLEDTLTLYDKIEGCNKASYATDITFYDGYLYISTNETPAQVVKVELDYNGLGEQRWRTYTLDTGSNNAEKLSINETFEELYVACSNGKMVRFTDLDNLDTRTVVTIESTSPDDMITIADSEEFLCVFIGTDSSTAEIYKLDYTEVSTINTHFTFLKSWRYMIDTYLAFIKGIKINTDLRFLITNTPVINTDLRFLSQIYADMDYIGRLDFVVKIDGTQLRNDDVRLNSIRIQHLADEPSKATFVLARKYDRLDTNEDGDVSQITNQNVVTIYIDNRLEFTGKINNLAPEAESEEVLVEATSTDTWTRRMNTVNLPIPSVNEQHHQYLALVQRVEIDNPNPEIGMTTITGIACGIGVDSRRVFGRRLVGYEKNIEGNKIITGTGNKFTRSMEGLTIDIISGTGATVGDYKIIKFIDSNTVELDKVPTVKTPNNVGLLTHTTLLSGGIGYVHDNPVVYRGIKVSLGKHEIERVYREDGTDRWDIGFAKQNRAGLADDIESGDYIPDPNYEYFWDCDVQYLGTWEGKKFNKIMPQINPTVEDKYIGSLQPLTADLYNILGLGYKRQRIYPNWVYPETFYYVGTYPYKEISVLPNGRYDSTPRWEERNNKLYSVTSPRYNYRNYVRKVADLEYEKMKNINDDILPIANATIDLTIDGFLYYDIKLLTRLNITNTTILGVYKDNNGFPVSVKSIIIDSSTMKVTLETDNTKSEYELEKIDERYPIEPKKYPETYTYIATKYDLPNQTEMT